MKHAQFNTMLLGRGRNLVVGFFTLLSLSAAAQQASPVLEYLPSPAPENSSLSRIVSDEAGQVYLSWVTEQDQQATLAFATLHSDGWSQPEIISEGSDWFLNWADFPALSVHEGNRAASWLRKSAEGTYDYDIEARFYDSKVGSWSAAHKIHSDGVSAEHGFVSMLPMASGGTLITWLDGRETVKEGGAMTLRAGVFDAAGKTLNEWQLDPRVCDCCQTSSAMTKRGPVVVYRDRSADEIRDITLTRYSAGSWSTPKPVHSDNWQIAGCPVNGPAVAAREEQLAIAWFTAKDDTPKVQLALSADSGDTFSQPLLVASPDTNGRVGVVILDSGSVVVSWLDTSAAQAKLMLSRFSADGVKLEDIEVADTSASRRSGFPIIEAVAESVYLSWTDISAAPRLRVARVAYGR